MNDEITEVQFKEELDKMTPEDKAAVEAKVKTEPSTILSDIQKAKALLKEKIRVGKKLEDEPEGKVDIGTKFREEQVVKAKKKFQTEFSIDEKDMPSYDEAFKKLDEGHTDADNIFDNLKRVYAYKNPDSLLDAKKKIDLYKNNADEFTATMAGANGGGSGGESDEEMKKFSPEARALVKKAEKEGTELSLEAAQRYLHEGLTRKL